MINFCVWPYLIPPNYRNCLGGVQLHVKNLCVVFFSPYHRPLQGLYWTGFVCESRPHQPWCTASVLQWVEGVVIKDTGPSSDHALCICIPRACIKGHGWRSSGSSASLFIQYRGRQLEGENFLHSNLVPSTPTFLYLPTSPSADLRLHRTAGAFVGASSVLIWAPQRSAIHLIRNRVSLPWRKVKQKLSVHSPVWT